MKETESWDFSRFFFSSINCSRYAGKLFRIWWHFHGFIRIHKQVHHDFTPYTSVAIFIILFSSSQSQLGSEFYPKNIFSIQFVITMSQDFRKQFRIFSTTLYRRWYKLRLHFTAENHRFPAFFYFTEKIPNYAIHFIVESQNFPLHFMDS